MVTDARGSVGGVTYSRNRGGAYSRARVAPINVRSTKQTQVRANFAANSKAWSGTLTAAQRTAWTNFAASNPRVNILGAPIIISGLAMFNSLNQVLTQLGSAAELDPPADLSVPALATVTGCDTDAALSTVMFTSAVQAVVANAKYYVFATRPMAPGKTPQQSDYRFLQAIAGTAAAVLIDVSAAYVASYGAWTAGASIGTLIASVNTDTGAVTPGLKFNTISS